MGDGTVPSRYFLGDGTVPSRYFLGDGTVPSRYFLGDGTVVPSRYFLEDGTVPSPKYYHLFLTYMNKFYLKVDDLFTGNKIEEYVSLVCFCSKTF